MATAISFTVVARSSCFDASDVCDAFTWSSFACFARSYADSAFLSSVSSVDFESRKVFSRLSSVEMMSPLWKS